MGAALYGHHEVVEALLKNGADVDAYMEGGATALMLAARNGHPYVVEALLKSGADVNAKDPDGDGDTALINVGCPERAPQCC